MTHKKRRIPAAVLALFLVLGILAGCAGRTPDPNAPLPSQAETKNTGKWIQNMDPEDQYRLITELLEPEFGSLYVTPPDIDERVRQLSFTISEGIHRALF